MSESSNGAAAPPGEQATDDGRWYPGMPSPNAAGRPPKIKSLTAALEGITDQQELAEKLWSMAQGSKVSAAVQLEAIKYIYARIEGNPVQAMRFQADGVVMPLIFLHPGKEAPALNYPGSNGAADEASEPAANGGPDAD